MVRVAQDPLSAVVRVRFFGAFGYQFVYLHALDGQETLGPRVLVRKAPKDVAVTSERAVAPGDRVVSVQSFSSDKATVNGLQFLMRLGAPISGGECVGHVTTMEVPAGTQLSGLKLKGKRVVSSIKLRTAASPTLDDLTWALAQLRHACTKTASSSVISFKEAYEAAVKWVSEFTGRGVVAVPSLVAALIQIGSKAKALLHPVHCFLRTGQVDCSAALDKLRAVVEKLQQHHPRLAAVEAAYWVALDTDTERTQLRSFITQDVTEVNYQALTMLHSQYPRLLFYGKATDRLLEYLFTSKDLDTLQQVVREHAATMEQPISVAMAAIAQRIPAVRLAIVSEQAAVLCWLLDTAKLEPLNPPSAPPGRLSLFSREQRERFALPPLELVQYVKNDQAKAVIFARLDCVRRRRRFFQTAITLLARETEAVTSDELHALVHDVTHVSDLSPLDALAKIHLPTPERHALVLACAQHVADHKLVLEEDDVLFFKRKLKQAHSEGLISLDEYDRLELRASRVNMESAPFIAELQHAVRKLEITVTNIQMDVTLLQRDVGMLRQWAIDMQQAAVDSRQRQRIVSLVSTVLFAFCAPLCQALVAWLDLSDPVRLLSAITSVDTASVGRSILDEGVGYVLDATVERTFADVGIEPTDVVTVLHAAARRPAVDKPAVLPVRARDRFRQAVREILVRAQHHHDDETRSQTTSSVSRNASSCGGCERT